MRKVILETPIDNVITVNDVHNDKYYGVEHKSGTTGSRGFITRVEFNRGRYMTLSLGAITNGNNLCVAEYEYCDLKTYIAQIIREGHTVIEFDSNRELMQWVLLNY